MPFGGNIQGVGAATRIYFGKPPDRVTPRRGAHAGRDSAAPGRHARAGRRRTPSLLAARANLAASGWRTTVTIAGDRRQLDLPIVARPQFAMPWQAPHFVDAVLANRTAAEPARIDTTIDAGLQRLIERQIQRYLEQYGDRGIRNAASALVDTRDMSVKAWVGSADYWNEDDRRAGQRRAGKTIAGFDAEAVCLRARARSGRASSADDAARCADVVRSLHAGEFRRPLLRAHQRGSSADSQPQHPRRVGRDRSSSSRVCISSCRAPACSE